MAETRVFHPRLTNLGGDDFSPGLPLPCIPVAPLDEDENTQAPKATKKLLAKLGELLGQTDVSYL